MTQVNGHEYSPPPDINCDLDAGGFALVYHDRGRDHPDLEEDHHLEKILVKLRKYRADLGVRVCSLRPHACPWAHWSRDTRWE